MAILFAYLMVVLIWATTPLTIQWSGDSISFMAGVALRMSLALALGMLVNLLLSRPSLFSYPGSWKVYAVASIGIFPNMPVVYWSAQAIPSGLVAVIFAMSPFVTGVMSLLILRENPFSPKRLLALLLALLGLALIFHDQWRLDVRAALGVLGILFSSLMFSLSSVWLKKLNTSLPAFDQAVGALLFAVPGLLLLWWLVDGSFAVAPSTRTAAAIVYLAVFGSLLGFTLFFYVLKKLSASAVSLITLMTPVLAVILGALAAGERLTLAALGGALLVLLALALYVDWRFGRWFERALARTSLTDNSLEDLKEEFVRYK